MILPGRCRSERLYWNDTDATFARTRNPGWFIEASGTNALRLIVPSGLPVAVAPRGRPNDLRDLDPQAPPGAATFSVGLSAAEIYRIGAIYIRIE